MIVNSNSFSRRSTTSPTNSSITRGGGLPGLSPGAQPQPTQNTSGSITVGSTNAGGGLSNLMQSTTPEALADQREFNRLIAVGREATNLWNQGKRAEAQQYRINNGLWPVDILWYNPTRHDFAGGSVRYSGMDFRGNQISSGNMQQFLLDYADIQRALNRTNSGQGGLYENLQPLWDRGIANFGVKTDPATGERSVYVGGINNGFSEQLLSSIISQAPQLKTNPDLIPQVIQQSPQFVSEAWNWVNGNTQAATSKEASKDKGGFGVVAEGLGQAAQFAGLASGLAGITAGLNAITSGAGLSGAFNAGMNAAGSIANIGDVVGGIVGNPAIGNITNVGVGGIVGGNEGGVPGALIGAGGAAIGAGIDYAGGIGEFVQNPLEALGGAFDVVGGAGTNITGLLNDMGSAAQVGTGSLAQNTGGVPLGGVAQDFADEVITVTASAPGATGNAGWLISTLASAGLPTGPGVSYTTDAQGRIDGYTFIGANGVPQIGVLGTPIAPDIPASQTGTQGEAAGGGGTAVVPGGTTGSASTGSTLGGGAATIGGNLPGTSTTPVGGSGGAADVITPETLGGGGITGPGTAAPGTSGGIAGTETGVTTGTGGGTSGTGGLLTEAPPVIIDGIVFGSPEWWDKAYRDAAISGTLPISTPTISTPTTPIQPTPTQPTQPTPTQPTQPAQPTPNTQDYWDQLYQQSVAAGTVPSLTTPTPPTAPSWATAGTGPTQTFGQPNVSDVTPTQPAPGSPEAINQAILAAMALGGTAALPAVMGGSSWAAGGGSPQTFTTPPQPSFGSQDYWDQIYGQSQGGTSVVPTTPGAPSWASGGGTAQDFTTPSEGATGSQNFWDQIYGQSQGGTSVVPTPPGMSQWAGGGGAVQDFTTPGQGGTQGDGLSDAELAALLTGGAGAVGIIDALGTGGGSGTGGVGTGTGTGTGTGIGSGTGPGTGPGTDGTGTGGGTGLDLLMPQLQGLLQTGFQPGSSADFEDPFSVGSIIKPGQFQKPKTPARKKRGVRVNISGRYRNA